MRKPFLASATLVTIGNLASPATAAEPRVHDGFHVRGGIGLGYAGDSFESDELLIGEVEGSLGGVAIVGELSAGYAVFRGSFVGGGFYLNHTPSPKAKDVAWGDGEIDEITFDSGTYWMIGPMLDYYFDPDSGLHLTGSIGYARLGLGDGEVEEDIPFVDLRLADQHAGGISGMIGVGYDFWVSDIVSLGVLGRFMLARVSGEDDDDLDYRHTVYSPAVLFSASFD
ncbi:MAG: hypothetical protein JW751_13545 [Polyangiaceae bacterium]|nr:hypothetical protein [Polyangiaceae bacterium]